MHKLRMIIALAPALLVPACSFDFGKLFMRDDPRVEEARQLLDAASGETDADLSIARSDLEQVLQFNCESDGGRDLVMDRPFASVDLGLVLFRMSELIGRRFGDEESDAAIAEAEEQVFAARAKELACAQLFLMRLESDPATDAKIALRARYLLGNFAFLARRYTDAVARYDSVLLAHPARGKDVADAAPDDEDAIARAAAWNRAIALKRIDDQKNDAGSDTPDTSPPDAADGGDSGGNDGGNDSGQDGAQDSGDGGAGDGTSDTGNNGEDSGNTADGAASDAPAPMPSSAPAPSSSVVDLRELDRFDQKAPLDLDFKKKLEQKKKLPKSLDK